MGHRNLTLKLCSAPIDQWGPFPFTVQDCASVSAVDPA